jgi:protein ImuB
MVEQKSRGEFVRYCNGLTRKRGVRLGMPVSEARSLLRPRDRLIVESLHEDDDRAALGELTKRCEPFSPCIGLEEGNPPESLLLDVTGIAPFFSGEQPLTQELEKTFITDLFEVRIGIASTLGSAWAAAHFLARPLQAAIIQADESDSLLNLPVAGLRLDPAELGKFQRLGITTIREVVNLDRTALLRRFGPELLLRLDQFTGVREESITPWMAAPRFIVEQSLEEGIADPEFIEQLWSTLLHRLLQKLEPKRLGLRQLDCRFDLENRTELQISLRLCRPTADLRHISDLLQLKLEQVRWESPLVSLFMEGAEVALIESSQHELFAGASQNLTRSLSILLNRLSGRLGDEAVCHPVLSPDPVPERGIEFVPLTEDACSTSIRPARYLPVDRPTALYPQPREVEVIASFPDGPPAVLFWKGNRFEIASHWGPERIEFGWWRGSIRRDYYHVETTGGAWLWLYQQLQDRRWFWHGEML